MGTADPQSEQVQELIERCLAGDEAGWRRFVDVHSRLVYSIPKRNGFDDSACEDIFQEVFLAAFRHLDSIRDARSVPKWLITTAVRACAARAKRDRRSRRMARGVRAPSPDEMDRVERLHELHAALDQVGERCRELVLAVFRDRPDPGYRAISEELGVPRGSIGPTRQRCLEKLAKLMTDSDFELERIRTPRADS